MYTCIHIYTQRIEPYSAYMYTFMVSCSQNYMNASTNYKTHVYVFTGIHMYHTKYMHRCGERDEVHSVLETVKNRMISGGLQNWKDEPKDVAALLK